MKLKRFFAIALLTLTSAHASDEFQPATFEHQESKRRLADRIEFPDVSGKVSAMLVCFSQIEKSGRMKSTGCYTKDNYETQFAAAVVKAAKKASMTPAMIDGKPYKIYMQFRVEFIADGEDRVINLYPNPGITENIEAYGEHYIAGQRVIGSEPWQRICPQRAKYLVLVRAFLGEDGRSESPSVERISGIMPTADCQDALKETILNSRYTPAMADGYPVPSAFVESFSN
ncbi:MAG: energy transducer TonB [Woeseiaceae bacterium]|nr:energy transducer TonB [Woeseiaceae bacterium]